MLTLFFTLSLMFGRAAGIQAVSVARDLDEETDVLETTLAPEEIKFMPLLIMTGPDLKDDITQEPAAEFDFPVLGTIPPRVYMFEENGNMTTVPLMYSHMADGSSNSNLRGNVAKAPYADHKPVLHTRVFYDRQHGTMKNRLHHPRKFYWYQTCGVHTCEKNATYYFEPEIPDCSPTIAKSLCTWEGRHCDPGLGCGIMFTCLPRFAKPSCQKSMQ